MINEKVITLSSLRHVPVTCFHQKYFPEPVSFRIPFGMTPAENALPENILENSTSYAALLALSLLMILTDVDGLHRSQHGWSKQ